MRHSNVASLVQGGIFRRIDGEFVFHIRLIPAEFLPRKVDRLSHLDKLGRHGAIAPNRA